MQANGTARMELDTKLPDLHPQRAHNRIWLKDFRHPYDKVQSDLASSLGLYLAMNRYHHRRLARHILANNF